MARSSTHRWEEKQLQVAKARVVFERALEELADLEKSEKLYIAFAHFEERCVAGHVGT
jgi:crooked neck